METNSGSPDKTTEIERRRLRVFFHLDCEDEKGEKYVNSPGLLPLLGFIREKGHDVRFFSSKISLMNALREDTADVIGISSMERMLPESVRLANEIRSFNRGSVLMLGGNGIEPYAIDLAAGLFDVVVLGEGELVLPAILAAIARSRGITNFTEREELSTVVYKSIPRVAATADPGGALTSSSVTSLLSATFPRRGPSGQVVHVGVSDVVIRDSTNARVWILDRPSGLIDLQSRMTWSFRNFSISPGNSATA